MIGHPIAAYRTHELAFPPWHTAAFVALVLGVALMGTLLHVGAPGAGAASGAASGATKIVAVYLPAIVVQWLLVLYVTRVGRRQSALPTWTGPVTRTPLLADVALAASAYVVIVGLASALTGAAGASRPSAAPAMLPATAAERAAWIVLALSFGIAEEIVYRGYLWSQLAALTGSAVVGCLLQAVLFAIAHADQGLGAMARIAVYAIVLAVVAGLRRSVVPAALCHCAIDVVSGLG